MGCHRIVTADRQQPLRVVPDPDDTAIADVSSVDECRGETVAAQWDPENQLVGALMWLPAGKTRVILKLVPDSAIWRPMTRWAYETIRRVVDAGRDPDPVTVLAYARQRSATQALRSNQAPTRTVSAAAAASYAREVLDEAYRRAFRAQGIRMQQLAECGADRADLTEQFAAIRDELADLWRRAEAAAQPGWGAA